MQFNYMELENSIYSYTGLFTHCAQVKGFSTLYLYLQRFSFFPFFLPSQYYSQKERGNTGLKILEISLRDQKTLLLDFHPYNQCTADPLKWFLLLWIRRQKCPAFYLNKVTSHITLQPLVCVVLSFHSVVICLVSLSVFPKFLLSSLQAAKSLSCSSASLTASYHISNKSSTLISKLFLVFSFSKHIACVLGITYVNSPAFKAAGPSLENKLYSPHTPGLQCLSCHSHLHLTQ